jgi:hypothetical protein
MIYIISEFIEATTDEVIAYCLKGKNKFTRLNYEDMPLDDLTIETKKTKFQFVKIVNFDISTLIVGRIFRKSRKYVF